MPKRDGIYPISTQAERKEKQKQLSHCVCAKYKCLFYRSDSAFD